MSLSPQETATQGVHAEMLLKDPTLNLAIENMIDNIHDAFADRGTEMDELPELKRRLVTVESFLSQLKTFMDDGEMQMAIMQEEER